MLATQHSQSDLLPLSHSGYAAQLFRTSLFSDCMIRSQHRIWYMHRCVLSPRCEFFWKCFQGDFEEASSSTVEMHDDDPETLERLLQWIYLLRYPDFHDQNGMQTAWTGDLMLYMMAEKYGLTDLMDATKNALVNRARECRNDPEKFTESVEDYADAIQLLYEELPVREDILSIREEILKTIAPVIAKYMRQIPVLQELMTTVPDFGLSLVEALAQHHLNRKNSTSAKESFDPISSTNSAQYVKPYIPLNEDSDEELE